MKWLSRSAPNYLALVSGSTQRITSDCTECIIEARSLADTLVANGVAAAASELAKISRQAAATQSEGKNQLVALANLAGRFNAADLKSARNGFGDLSDALIAYLKTSKAKTNPPYQFYCSMVKKNWLQPEVVRAAGLPGRSWP